MVFSLIRNDAWSDDDQHKRTELVTTNFIGGGVA